MKAQQEQMKALVGAEIDARLGMVEARLENMVASCKSSMEAQLRTDLLKTLGPAIHSVVDEKLALALKTPAIDRVIHAADKIKGAAVPRYALKL
jgi:hypothetical protein